MGVSITETFGNMPIFYRPFYGANTTQDKVSCPWENWPLWLWGPSTKIQKMYIIYCKLISTFSFNSSGVFMSASEDETGILDSIEEKIAKATKIPRTHGEVTSLFSWLSRSAKRAFWKSLLIWFTKKIFLMFFALASPLFESVSVIKS